MGRHRSTIRRDPAGASISTMQEVGRGGRFLHGQNAKIFACLLGCICLYIMNAIFVIGPLIHNYALTNTADTNIKIIDASHNLHQRRSQQTTSIDLQSTERNSSSSSSSDDAGQNQTSVLIVPEYNKDGTPVIDAVFTYVNGSDPNFIQLAKSFSNDIDPSRYRDLGQLRYAMRSVFMNAPYIRKLFVVVNNKTTQTPSWLMDDHPRVQVVELEEIWDDVTNLPSMNSNAVEWATMNIPGLASLYLYFNDDFSIMKPLELSSVWAGPNAFILYQAWRAPNPSEVKRGLINDSYGKSMGYVGGLFDGRYGRTVNRKVGSHVPMLFNRTVMEMIRRDWPEQFEEMYRTKPFRTDRDMQFQFTYQQFILHHFKSTSAREPHVHLLEGVNDIARNDKMFRDALKNPYQYICLQDSFGADPDVKVLDQIHSFYKKLFDEKAPWERDT